ncbi:type 1 glutamine amidotransferase domain-containing protein [Streptomyces sp. P9(2023)]|uniref:type 1 glutamine amidotransferase domain-containing protein n=1 Tax=Streptomyces sp. P9(2023) TaxID=3064394 RepID=UPI0028F4163E|nr:type 1 glutamine amidotransferase domain-containing protein [Streptomyces sp. P9(2023)]MDT9689047.1 type 1 glutamine amidotransferase domain-containing protein [Streptomyces sp. P9(2023)]
MSINGKHVLVLTTNYGTEQDELKKPVAALRAAGARVTVAAKKAEPVVTLVSDRRAGEAIEPDTTYDTVSAADYDAVVVPGGTVNADRLRTDQTAERLLVAFATAGKVVAAICHGPWLLIDSGLVAGKEVTSYPSIATDLVNAGGTWRDREVVVDRSGGFPLITSRRPADVGPFSEAIIEALVGAGLPAPA